MKRQKNCSYCCTELCSVGRTVRLATIGFCSPSDGNKRKESENIAFGVTQWKIIIFFLCQCQAAQLNSSRSDHTPNCFTSKLSTIPPVRWRNGNCIELFIVDNDPSSSSATASSCDNNRMNQTVTVIAHLFVAP